MTQRTFGPVVVLKDGSSEFVAKCLHQGYYCIFGVNLGRVSEALDDD